MFSSFSGSYQEEGLLGQPQVTLFSIFWATSTLFFIVTAPLYIPPTVYWAVKEPSQTAPNKPSVGWLEYLTSPCLTNCTVPALGGYAFYWETSGVTRPPWNKCFSEECLGALVCFLPVDLFPMSSSLPFHAYSKSLLLQIGDEARWRGGAPAWGSSVVFIISASLEWMVSKSLFLFPLGCLLSHTTLVAGPVQIWCSASATAWPWFCPGLGLRAQEGNKVCK